MYGGFALLDHSLLIPNSDETVIRYPKGVDGLLTQVLSLSGCIGCLHHNYFFISSYKRE